MKYIKKRIEVEAHQFTDENKNQVLGWAKSLQQNVYHSTDGSGNPTLLIPTLEGEMVCTIGDYLIQEPFPTDWRKLYPCKPTIFVNTYEPISSESPSPSTGIREALEKIAYPIKYLQDEAKKEGMQLDGRYALELAQNANWLSEIARKALATLK